MLGIPFTIRRFPERGVEDVDIYLRTRRRGPAGEKMRREIRAYHQAQFDRMKAASRAGMLVNRATSLTEIDDALRVEALEKIEADQIAQMDLARLRAEDTLEHAEAIAACALADNYPREQAEEIVDGLTDQDLHGIVATIEMGAMPKDFFPLPATPPSPSSTAPSGSEPGPSSSAPAGAGPTSSAG